MTVKTITVFNNKGGVGKTTTIINLAYNLANAGKKVLVIDADAQENTTWFFKRLNSRTDFYKVMQFDTSIEKAIRRTDFENLDIVPGSTATELIDGIDENVLKKKIDNINKNYDVIIIDCGPCVQMQTINAIKAADRIIVPIKPDKYSLIGLNKIVDTIELVTDKSRAKALLTNYTSNKNNNNLVAELIESGFNAYSSVIRYGRAADSSITMRRPLARHKRNAGITEDYKTLTNEIIAELSL